MLALITSKLGMAGIALALVLGTFGYLRIEIASRDHTIAGYKAAQISAKADVARHEATASAISSEAQSNLQKVQSAIETRTRTLIQKVPVYVDAKSDAACTVGTGFVSVFNAASRGETELPRPAGGSGGSPSGVPLSAVLSATVEDFGVAYDWRAEALGWRSWYADQKAAWDRK